MTYEWREQGIHEFLIHQLIWKPLTGRVWWNGGYHKLKASQDEAGLLPPVEPLDVARLIKGSRKGKGRAIRVSTGTQDQDDDDVAGDEEEGMLDISAQEARSNTPGYPARADGAGNKSGSSSGSGSEEEWEKLDMSRALDASMRPLGSVGAQSAQRDDEKTSRETGQDDEDAMTLTWFGQSTCLVQSRGITMLTDPVFGDQPMASIFAPTRLRDTPCSLEELLRLNIVDVVLLSHDHFDHLDEDVVKKLGDRVLWVVPLGLGKFFEKRRVYNVVEMDWWQERDLTLSDGRQLHVACTPAQHWSGRTPWGANQSLWCGFVARARGSSKTFFHCGDTGYSRDLFEAVGRAYGPISLAALPIGSYDPRWIMGTVHTDPAGAVSIHRHLSIGKSVAVHHSTWILSDERFDEPPKELERQLKLQNVSQDDFVVIPPGRIIQV